MEAVVVLDTARVLGRPRRTHHPDERIGRRPRPGDIEPIEREGYLDEEAEGGGVAALLGGHDRVAQVALGLLESLRAARGRTEDEQACRGERGAAEGRPSDDHLVLRS